MTKPHDSSGIKLQEFILPSFRKELQNLNLNQVSVIPYKGLSSTQKQQWNIIQDDIALKNIYAVVCRDSIIHLVLIDSNRIESYPTMSFGGKRVFMQ